MKHRWMPMFWGDFFANTLHLSAQEIGAYVCLIAHAWEHRAMIPADGKQLRRIARVRGDQWPRVWKVLEPFFEKVADGTQTQWYMSSRVLHELHHADEISNKRKAAALQMHSKCTSFASVLHMQKGMQNGGNHQVRKKDPLNGEIQHPSKIEEISPARSLATAPCGGALTREPSSEDDELKQGAGDKKRPDETSRQELEAIFAAKRTAGKE